MADSRRPKPADGPASLRSVRRPLAADARRSGPIQDTVARFTDERVLPIIGDAFDQGRFPKELVPEIADLGLLGSSLPEQVRLRTASTPSATA